MNWYLKVIRQYADFSGRARRKEYWYFVLFNFLIMLCLTGLDTLIGTYAKGSGTGLLSGLYSLAVLIPGIAVVVRRLHDTDRSGWWFFIQLIPLIGGIIMLVFTVQDSQEGTNQYGENPKEIE